MIKKSEDSEQEGPTKMKSLSEGSQQKGQESEDSERDESRKVRILNERSQEK